MNLVAIQGVKGSYSEKAARNICDLDVELKECNDFVETFESILNNTAAYAVVPVFNKIVGKIETPNRLLQAHNLRILDKLDLKIEHNLIGTAEAELKSLNDVYSHAEALKQCRKFFSMNRELRQTPYFDTASSVKKITRDNIQENAAIGSREAAEIYGGKILTEHIADDLDNWTTFYLIGK